MATSEVINKIKIKKGEIETKLQQKFAMTSASNKPLMTFSVNDKIIGSITNKLLLNLNEEVVTALPPEVKENLILLGNATLKIEPTSEGISPIEVDTDNNELKVHVKAKDGNKNYECRINATGVYIKYNDHETSYTPKEVEGNEQGIDITMSTRCFERMLDSKDTNIKLVRTSKSKNITTQIPSFMLGTYLEATVQQEETTREYDISENFSAFALTLPSKEGKNTYHFLKNKENGQAFAFHSGSLKPVQSFAIFTTRDENGNVKSPYLKLNVGTKANPKYAFIDLPKSNGETAVQSEYLDAVTQLKDFYDDSVKFPKPESGFSEIGKDSKGNEIIAEWASSDDERKFDTKLKGKTFTFTVEQGEKERSPEVFNAIVENADKTDEAPIKEPDNTPVVTAEPISIEADEPVTEEKSGRERLSEETPFTSTPMKSVDMSKVKSKISPDWGVNMMLAGMVLMLVGLLFAPAFAAVFAAVGVAVTAGGAWLAVNADRLANPYLKLEQYIIDPLRKKERASEKEREAHWEKTKELNAASAKADATKENLLDTDENHDAKYWSEIFGEGYQDFINESNLLKRKAFLEELQLINNANGSEKGKMLEAFKARYGLSEDALNSLLDEEKVEERNKALAAMRKLNQQQEDVYNKQIDMIENTKNLNEFTFKKLCQDMKNLSPEARQVAMEQNKYALAMHLMSQKNLSQAATEQILSVLPEDCRQTLTESIAEISKISEQVDEIVHESALRTQEHQKTLDYAETLKDIHSSKTKNVDGKTIADAVEKRLLKEQKDINLGLDIQGKQKLLTIEKIVGKTQAKVLADTSLQALKKQNNITDTHQIGKIQEFKKGRSVDEDVSAKEKWSSKNFHKTEEKYDTRAQLRKEGLQKLMEIMKMPDDTGKERINALSEYLGSFPVDTPTPFDAPDLSAKGFDFNKWAEKVVKQVKNKQKIDDQDMAEAIAHMAGFKRVTSKTTSAETIAKNAAIFTEAVKEKSASSKTSEEEEGKENITKKEADEKRFNPFKLKGPQERESD